MKTKFKILLLTLMLSAVSLNAQSLRIQPINLVSNITEYKILDTRSPSLYKEGHIKGALSFPIELTYEYINNNGKLTNPIKMQKILRNLGLTLNSKIIVYDNGDFFDASRLFWSLEVYGFTNVKVLNTTYNKWKSLGYPTSKEKINVTPSNYVAKVNNNRIATKFTTQIATKNPNQIIIDARGEKAYNGNISSAKRFGHIPKALNYPASHNINYTEDHNSLQTINQLKEVYKNVDKTKKVVLYCAIGRISASNYLIVFRFES